jgi:hypothetical protein
VADGRRELWKKRVEAWVASGLRGAEFAARIGVKEQTLRHWKWQLGYEARQGKARREPKEPSTFVEIVPAVSAQLVGAAAFELILGDGRQLKVPASFDEVALRRLLAVLEGR